MKKNKLNKPKKQIKQINQIKKENKKIDVEDYISNKGWNKYINHCVNIIYFNFNHFGWTYGKGKEVTRKDIKDNILHLIESSIEMKNQVESGRIAVDIVEDTLWIALTL